MDKYIIEIFKRMNDRAYLEHVNAIQVTDAYVGKEGFNSPSELFTVGDNEYRTIFEHKKRGIVAIITTRLYNGNSDIIITTSKNKDIARNKPLSMLKRKKYKLREIILDNFEQRHKSIKLALENLEIIPTVVKEKNIVESCVKYNDKGERYIDYEMLNTNDRLHEEYILDYSLFNKINKEIL